MACKLKCPQCGMVLKEKDDEGKRAQGEYRVFYSYDEDLDKVITSHTTTTGKRNVIQCLNCDYHGDAKEFDMDLYYNG